MKNLFTLLLLFIIIKSQAQEIRFGKVSLKELEETFSPIDSTANAAYLLNHRKTYITLDENNGWMVNTEFHQRIKIYKQEGLNFATKKINYRKPKSSEDRERITGLKSYSYNLIKGKIVRTKLSKKDVFEEKLNNFTSRKTLTFPNVKEGSIVELKYKVTSPYWQIEPVIFEYNIPIKQFFCTVEIPQYFTFSKNYVGYFTIPAKASISQRSLSFSDNSTLSYDVKRYTFSKENIEAINENEPYARNINNYRGKVKFELSNTKFPNSKLRSYNSTWQAVCKNILKSSSFGKELKKTKYFEEELSKIITKNALESDKINSIFEFVKQKVKWNEYYGKYTENGVKKAFKEGTGNVADINLMLTSMLRSADINANPVLVSTKDSGIPIYPTSNEFNYVVTKVNLKNGTSLLLDASAKYSFSNILPYHALNWFGREVFPDGNSKTVELIPTKHTKENNILFVKIDPDLIEINGMYRQSFTGHNAMFFRQVNHTKKKEEIISEIEEKYNIEVDGFKILNDNNITKPITQTLKFVSEDLIEKVNGKLLFTPLLFLTSKENPFKTESRNFPIDYVIPWEDDFKVSIQIPNNYVIESIPKETSIALPDDLGVFKYIVSVKGNKIMTSSKLQVNVPLIGPEYYQTLKEFYKTLIEKQTENIVLIKKS